MQHNGYDHIPQESRLAKYLGSGTSTRGPTTMSTMSVNVPSFVPQFAQLQMREQQQNGSPSSTNTYQSVPDDYMGESHGGTMYFYPQGARGPPISQHQYETAGSLGSPVDQNDSLHPVVNTGGSFVFSTPPHHVGKFRGKTATSNPHIAQFMSQDLKLELVTRQLAMKAKPEVSLYPEIPQNIEHMRDVVPLEAGSVKPPNGYQQSVFKATSIRDGVTYVLRRVHGYRAPNQKALVPAEMWKKLQAAHVVQLREVFATRAFGDNSLIFVYDYHTLAETFKERHFGRNQNGGGGGAMIDAMTGAKIMYPGASGGGLAASGVPELQLWQYVVQLTAALRSIHSSGLAARTLDISKVIVVGKCKVLLSACGVVDIISSDHQPTHSLQSDDMVALGRLLLALATGNQHAARRDVVAQSLALVATHYSGDMKNLIGMLLGPSQRKTTSDIMPMIGARFYHHIEVIQMRCDMLENEAAREIENGRLFRLLCKLNTIVERREHNMDPSWSETGDRFLIKLFRDYVFHQVTESGKPWMDMAHIVTCLNKLDAGVNEKIELVSRDQDNVIIVSYSDLRRCIDTAFSELSTSTVPAMRGGAPNARH